MNYVNTNAAHAAEFRSAPTTVVELDTESGSSTLPLLTQYLRILLRRRWWIIGMVVASLVIGLVVTLLTTRQYTAASTLEIQREGDRVVKLEGVERETTTSDLEFYQTQYGLLKARSLAERVARTTKIADNPRFIAAYKLEPKPGVVPLTKPARDARAAAILLKNVAVNPVRASRLVAVAYTSPDPTLSANIANAWGKNFIESNLERRFESTSYARDFLEGRLQQLRQRLEESERALVAYAGAQKIINLPAATVTPGAPGVTSERSLVADDLASLNTELGVAIGDRVKAESRLRSSAAGSSPEALSNASISSLRQRRAEAAAEYAKLMVQFEPGYPAARALAQQVSQLDAAIAREEGRVSSSITSQYREALAREQALSARVERLKGGLLDLRRRSIQYNIYQREVDTNRELYDGLLQRYKEIGIAGGVGNNNISIVDVAQVPDGPSKPNLPANMLVSLMLGLVLGIVLAIAREQIDEAITDPDDLVSKVGLPLLGAIPKIDDPEPALALEDRKSSLVEAYLSVHTALGFTTAHGAPRSMSVTSSRPAEGKSLSAYALALTMARAKRKVILIDCDMRSPSIHGIVGVENGQGVSNFLSGTDALAGLVRPAHADGLSIMSAGPQPPNAAELLAGDRLGELIARLLEQFDHVIVDSPPVMGLADAPLIASKVEGTVYVVESHAIRSSLVRVAIARLKGANAHLIGAVLTKFDSKRAHYGYGYEYGYGYGEAREASA
jgi:polysaccharide biosynthesis transport protein